VLSRELEQTLHRALALANKRRHEYATLEHLLLALTEDQDAIAVFRACDLDLDRLRTDLLVYIDDSLSNLVGSGITKVCARSESRRAGGADAAEALQQRAMSRSGSSDFICCDAVWTFRS
jgi:ATP-dependent Clp protease ATP-binding subunit ClpA